MEVLTVLVEIRDLLALQLALQTPKKKKKTARKPQTNGKVSKITTKKPPGPVWKISQYPFETWKVGTTKRYPIAEKAKVVLRTKLVNRRMKTRLHLPNHYSFRQVLEQGRIWIRVWRDK
jgi:hypothetical protein